MSFWHEFLDSLDTSGGHLVILLSLITIGLIASHYGFPMADLLVGQVIALLLLKLKEPGSNRQQITANEADKKDKIIA